MRRLAITATTSLVATVLVAAPAAAAPGDWTPTSPPTGPTWVVLESTPGDWVGQGQDHSYEPDRAVITVSSLTGQDGFRVAVDGDETWTGTFKVPTGEQLDERLYDGAVRHPSNSTGPQLSWSGEGRGCGALTGWFQVDGFTLDDTTGEVLFLALRFAQYCDGSTAPLHGAVRYDANAPDPDPVNPRPEPAGIWSPPSAALPADAAPVVYLESSPGDWVGQGQTWLHTGAEVTVRLGTNHRGIHVDVDPAGDGWWDGDFAPPDDQALTTGWYGELQRYPFHNPMLGGLSWSGYGRGCNTLDGWFMVDQLEVNPNGVVTVLSLRFQQHCEGLGAPPLRGIVQVGIDRTPPDTTAPTVTISDGPDDRTKAKDATFTFVADEPATFACSLDGQPAAPCSSPATVTGLEGGSHTFTVVATDPAGNVSAPATWSWSIKGGGGGKGGGKGGGPRR